MKKLLPIFILILVFGAFGQTVLDNNAVVEMVKSGLSETIILAKIRNTEVKFDTSTEALNKLVKEGVSENIIAVMIEKTSVDDSKRKDLVEKETKIEITLDSPENGQISELADKTKVYFYTSDATAREIMQRELKKYPRLESVDAIEKAEFILVYEITGARTRYTTVGEIDEIAGDLYAVTLGNKDAQGKTRVRILYSIRKVKDYVLDANPAKSTMQKFIKDLKKARGEK